jgi:transcriptional regulator with XRE-family HTH domain
MTETENHPHTVLYSEIGKNIARIRKELNLTQADLANGLKLQQQVIASYEIGRRRIPLQTYIELVKLLNIEFEDLLPSSFKRGKTSGPPPKVKKGYERILSLPQDDQNKILQHIDDLIRANS